MQSIDRAIGFARYVSVPSEHSTALAAFYLTEPNLNETEFWAESEVVSIAVMPGCLPFKRTSTQDYLHSSVRCNKGLENEMGQKW